MRRWTVTLAVLAILVGVSTPATAQDIAAMSFEQLTVAASATSLAEATRFTGGKMATRCVGVLETASIRIRVDGTAATASVGTLVPVGAFVDIRGVDNVRRFSAFRTGGTSGVLPLTCFPSPAEQTATPYLNLTPTPAVSAAGLFPDGTVSLPAMAPAADPDSGLYRIGANNLGLALGGTKLVDFGASGAPVSITKTITDASATTERLTYSKATLTPSTTMEIAAGGSIAGARGEVSFTTGKTFTDGFLYGVQGKGTFAGTMAEASAARITGVLGQTDVTGATLTAGQVSGVWADLQGNATNTQTFPLRVTNSMSSDARALGFFHGTATYLFEVSDAATAKFVENTAGTSAGQCAQTGGLVATKALKITANGVDYWIPLCTAK